MKVARLSALRAGRLYLQEILLLLVSVRDLVDTGAIVRQEGVNQRKIAMAPSGIEPPTFRIVAQYLNQTLHRMSNNVKTDVFHNLCIIIAITYSITIVSASLYAT
jgi:hypothetical protein